MEARETQPVSDEISFLSPDSHEIQSVPPSLLFHRRLNRRDFLKLAVGTASGLALSKDKLSSFYAPSQVEASNAAAAESLQLELETKHSIVIDTLKQTMDETGDTYFVEDPNSVPDRPWSIEQLNLLDGCLDALPSHMYAPNEEGKLHITLMPEESSPCRCVGLEYENEHFPQVLFIDKYFTSEDYEGSLSFLAHELTHRNTREFKHQVNPHIDEILGESYTTKREDIIVRLREVKQPLYAKVDELDKQYNSEGEKHLTEEEYEKYKFYQALEVGLGVGWYQLPTSDFPDEFVAVMAEHYLHGQNYFFENYSEIFSEENEGEIVEGLYSYIKSIFNDREYASLPVFSQPAVAQST